MRGTGDWNEHVDYTEPRYSESTGQKESPRKEKRNQFNRCRHERPVKTQENRKSQISKEETPRHRGEGNLKHNYFKLFDYLNVIIERCSALKLI